MDREAVVEEVHLVVVVGVLGVARLRLLPGNKILKFLGHSR